MDFRTIVAYVLVIPLVQFCLTIGTGAGGLPVAFILAWTPTSVHSKISGFCGGVAGVALSVAFGYGVFRLIAGPNSYTLGAFLASTAPLAIPIWNDFRQARLVAEARAELLRNMQGRDDQTIKVMEEETASAHGSSVLGEVVGILLATVWFLTK